MSTEKQRKRLTLKSIHKQATIRFQVEILEARVDQIGEVMAQTGLRTKRELFDNAISILEWAAQEAAAGNEVGSRTPTGEFRDLVTPTLITAAAIAKAKKKK